MTLLNTSFHFAAGLENEFLDWIRDIYFPASCSAGIFTDITLARIEGDMHPGTSAYCFQMKAADAEAARHWHDVTAAPLRGELQRRYADRLVFFSTFMTVIEL